MQYWFNNVVCFLTIYIAHKASIVGNCNRFTNRWDIFTTTIKDITSGVKFPEENPKHCIQKIYFHLNNLLIFYIC